MSIKVILQNDSRGRRVELPTVARATTLCLVQSLHCLDGGIPLIPQLDRHWQRYRQRLDVSPDALRLWTFVTGETAWIPGDDAPGVLLCHQPGDPLEILTLGCACNRRQRASQCPRLIAHGHADTLFANVQSQCASHHYPYESGTLAKVSRKHMANVITTFARVSSYPCGLISISVRNIKYGKRLNQSGQTRTSGSACNGSD